MTWDAHVEVSREVNEIDPGTVVVDVDQDDDVRSAPADVN